MLMHAIAHKSGCMYIKSLYWKLTQEEKYRAALGSWITWISSTSDLMLNQLSDTLASYSGGGGG